MAPSSGRSRVSKLETTAILTPARLTRCNASTAPGVSFQACGCDQEAVQKTSRQSRTLRHRLFQTARLTRCNASTAPGVSFQACGCVGGMDAMGQRIGNAGGEENTMPANCNTFTAHRHADSSLPLHGISSRGPEPAASEYRRQSLSPTAPIDSDDVVQAFYSVVQPCEPLMCATRSLPLRFSHEAPQLTAFTATTPWAHALIPRHFRRAHASLTSEPCKPRK